MAGRIRLIGWLALLLLCVSVVSRGFSATRKPWKRRPGVILYRFKENASDGQRAAFGRIFSQSHASSSSAGRPLKSHQTLVFPANGKDEEETAEELKASGAVEFAEPDYLMPAAATVPDDPQYAAQWFHQTINSPAAWGYTTGSASILIGVCDTGVDATHPDLAPNLSLPGYNVVDQSTNTDPVAAHGTEVAGVIGAVGNNALGVTGMNWTVKILPVRITDNPDTTAWCSDMANGIEWAADQNAKVINLSYEIMGCPATIDAASQYARSRGALVFVASGNDAQDISALLQAPPSFVFVGATDASDHPAIFSNYGAQVNLAAPGVSILTTQPGGYTSASGTSFAAPIAAGLAALLYSVNPLWTPAIVENLILATAKSVGPSNIFGYGRLDAGAALAAAQNCLAGNCVVPGPLANGQPPGQPADITVTSSDLSAVRVYPNPWRSDKHQTVPVTFDHLGSNSEIKIFTVSGHQVRTLPAASDAISWDLKNDSGDHVASGLYLYLVTNSLGQQARGKLAVIH